MELGEPIQDWRIPPLAAGALLTIANCVAPPLLAAQTPADSAQRLWLSGRGNAICQWHPAFRASYRGPNSLRPAREEATSRLATLYTGLRVGGRAELLLDLETAGGGVSQALGLAGFTNLDAVRNPTLGSAPYVARGLIRYTVALGAETERGTCALPMSLSLALDVQHLENPGYNRDRGPVTMFTLRAHLDVPGSP